MKLLVSYDGFDCAEARLERRRYRSFLMRRLQRGILKFSKMPRCRFCHAFVYPLRN